MPITDKGIIICGHGGKRPTTKVLHTYASLRYSQKASNGVPADLVQ